jgi:hypothetical protein
VPAINPAIHAKEISVIERKFRGLLSQYTQLFLLLAISVGVLSSQTYQGGIRGTVTDPQGAAISNVTITLVNEATSVNRKTTTNSSGQYVFTAVDPAIYAITAESPSFTQYERTNLSVGTQETVTADVQLQIGAVTQSVVVTEDAPTIENSSASNGQVLDTQQMADLPNLGRNPFLLSKLATNVEPVGDPRFNRFQDQSGSSEIAIGGGPVRGNNYLIDGIPITDSENRPVIIPSIEGTQEMKLQEDTYDAEMGRTGGGVFNVTLKSGGNTPHGSLFGYTRQTDWLANNYFFNEAGEPRAEQPFYNWGGSFGGPIVIPKVYNGKDKTFFWLTTESYRQKSPLSNEYTLPTAAEKAGDFAGASTIYNPLSSRACTAADNCPSGVTTVRTPFAGNVIPATMINPVGAAVTSYLPAPQTAALSNNFTGIDTLTDRADEYMAKLDHQAFSWLRLNASYLHYKSREPGGNTLGSLIGASSASPYLLYRKVDATQANAVITPDATTVVTARFGFNRFPNLTTGINMGFNPSTLGFPTSYSNALQAQYFPEFDLLKSDAGLGFSSVSPDNSVFYSRNFLTSVSKVIGRHTLTFGFDFRSIHTDFTNLQYAAGDYQFNGVFTQEYPTALNGTGSDIADLLLGYPSAGQVDTTTKLFTYVNYYAGYIQDDFRMSSKLTLNLGLRYEYETGIKEANNHLVVGFNESAVNPLSSQVSGITPTGVVEYAGVNGNPTECCNPLADKFGPRIGAAYQLNSKTVLRGGWGIFYAPIAFSDSTGIALGYTQATPYVASNNGFATPANSLSNPFPNGILQPVGNAQGALTGIGSNFNFLDQNRTSGIVYQYSFDIQRELPDNIALEVGYIGSRSDHLQPSSTSGSSTYDINQVPESDMSLGSALASSVANPYYGHGGSGVVGSPTVTYAQLLRPYSEFGTIGILTNPSYARYNSAIIKAQKRMSKGLTFLSAFTWSRNMDNEFGSGNFFSGSSSSPQDAYNLAAEYSLALYNTPLRWTNSVTYDLPFGKGKMFLNNSRKFVDLALGGWQINIVNIYQTGFPLAIYQSTNQNAVLGTGVQRPNATGLSPVESGSVEQRLNEYINPAAFSTAPSYTFGNLARTIPYRGPGMANWDTSLFKTFAITESVNAEFRAEALNVFNTPQFPNPNTQFGSTAFGTITSQVNFSRMLQLGVRLSF